MSEPEKKEEEEEPKLKCKSCHVVVNIYVWCNGEVILAMCPKCLGGILQNKEGNLVTL